MITPTLSLKPGTPRDCLNFEVSVTGAHTRVAGYARFDGKYDVAAAQWVALPLASSTHVPAVGTPVEGPGGTAVVVGVETQGSSTVLIVRPETGVIVEGDTVSWTEESTDPLMGQVIFLTNMNGANLDTTIADVSPLAATPTRYWTGAQEPNARMVNTGALFGTTVWRHAYQETVGFSNAMLYYPSRTEYAFPGDFTIEARFRVATTYSGSQRLVMGGPGGVAAPGANPLWAVNTGGGSVSFTSPHLSFGAPVGAPYVVGTWHHVAFVRQGGTLRVFLDGALVQTTTVSGSIPQFELDLFGPRTSSALPNDWLQTEDRVQAIRITKAARYTTAFTDVVQPFPSNSTVRSTTVSTTPTWFSPNTATSIGYNLLAQDDARASVGPVPGQGPVRGIARIGTTIYAWRDAVGGASLGIYRTSATGWLQVPLRAILPFNTGTGAAIQVGDIIQNPAGATAVVSQVVLESGSTWVGGSGRLVLTETTPTATWVAGDTIRVGGVTRATATGPAVAPTLLPGGRVQAVLGNVEGFAGAEALYGCDGVNAGFKFDGTNYIPINTGMTANIPTNVAVHKRRLFFSFGPSLQFSGVGTPFIWSVVLGAGEIAVRAAITALLGLPGNENTGALGVFTRDSTHILYGSSPTDFQMVDYERGFGAEKYTAAVLDQAYVLDRAGVTSMAATQNFGNFDSVAATFPMRPFTQERRGTALACAVSREKSQYRVFYPSGYAIFSTIVNGRILGSMPVQFPATVTCWVDDEVKAGPEQSFFGSDDGYVYRMESGTDFDGEPIIFTVTYNYAVQGNHRVYKRYLQAAVEMLGDVYAEYNFGYTLGYDSSRTDQPVDAYATNGASLSVWDGDIDWESFVFDESNQAPSEIECTGTAESIALIIRGSSRVSGSFTINTITLHYIPRRGLRGIPS